MIKEIGNLVKDEPLPMKVPAKRGRPPKKTNKAIEPKIENTLISDNKSSDDSSILNSGGKIEAIEASASVLKASSEERIESESQVKVKSSDSRSSIKKKQDINDEYDDETYIVSSLQQANQPVISSNITAINTRVFSQNHQSVSIAMPTSSQSSNLQSNQSPSSATNNISQVTSKPNIISTLKPNYASKAVNHLNFKQTSSWIDEISSRMKSIPVLQKSRYMLSHSEYVDYPPVKSNSANSKRGIAEEIKSTPGTVTLVGNFMTSESDIPGITNATAHIIDAAVSVYDHPNTNMDSDIVLVDPLKSDTKATSESTQYRGVRSLSWWGIRPDKYLLQEIALQKQKAEAMAKPVFHPPPPPPPRPPPPPIQLLQLPKPHVPGYNSQPSMQPVSVQLQTNPLPSKTINCPPQPSTAPKSSSYVPKMQKNSSNAWEVPTLNSIPISLGPSKSHSDLSHGDNTRQVLDEERKYRDTYRDDREHGRSYRDERRRNRSSDRGYKQPSHRSSRSRSPGRSRNYNYSSR